MTTNSGVAGCRILEGLERRVMAVSSLAQPDTQLNSDNWTTELGSGFHQILGVLIGLSRCYVNNRPLVAIAGYRSSWLDGEERLLPLWDGTPSENKEVAVWESATGARTILKRNL